MIVVPRKVVKQILDGQVTFIRKPTAGWVKGQSHVLRSSAKGQDLNRVRILGAPVLQLLHEVTDADARKEGWPGREALFAYWRETYDEGPLSQDVATYILKVEIDREERLEYLSTGVVAGKQGDYTSSASRSVDGPAPVVPRSYLKHLSEAARERDMDLRREERQRQKARSLAAKVREMEAKARKEGRDVLAQLEALERRLNGEDKAA